MGLVGQSWRRDDLTALLLQEQTGHAIVVEGRNVEIPTRFAIPLGFIVNELITNSVKYAKGNITVQLETSPTVGHSLSVSDEGPGMSEASDPASSKGLGMKIILSLVKQIGGSLQIVPGDNGCGTRAIVTFCSPRFEV